MTARVYTEEDVRRLPDGCELRLGGGAIATPSALDAARAKGLRITYAGEAASPPPAAEGALADLPGLVPGDGSYHLEVRGGRVRLWRTDGGS